MIINFPIKRLPQAEKIIIQEPRKSSKTKIYLQKKALVRVQECRDALYL